VSSGGLFKSIKIINKVSQVNYRSKMAYNGKTLGEGQK
jgi:hypothetical protein